MLNQQVLTIKQAIDLGLRKHNAGHLSQAEHIYTQVLQTDPNQPVALHLLGVIAHQVGKIELSIDLISRALSIRPDYAEAQNDLGNAFQDQGNNDAAVRCFRNALAIKPDFAEPYYNLGNLFVKQGSIAEALVNYKKSLVINPNYARCNNNCGSAYRELGQLNEAVTCYRNALATEPDYVEAHANLGNALKELGELSNAFIILRRAVTLAPDNNTYWAALAECLQALSFTSIDDGLWAVLSQVLECPSVRPSRMVRPVISALRQDPDFSNVLDLIGTDSPPIYVDYVSLAVRLASSPLFLKIMLLCPIDDLVVERMLTTLRRSLLQEVLVGELDEECMPFSTALALQCFTNEYIFFESKEETEQVEILQKEIVSLVNEKQTIPASYITALGAYRPLYQFSWARKDAQQAWPANIRSVVEHQIFEPLEELSLRSEFRRLTDIQNTVSLSVREQYEENPYPRWNETGLHERGRSIDAVLREPPLRFDLKESNSPKNPDILVAGCGTGQHALNTASRFSDANVLAVDLSLSSLSYALRKTKELKVSNIEYAQGDIMEMGCLDRRFDVVECCGVLHHLEDPIAGWKTLVELLRPGGFMKIALYSELARQEVISARSLVSEKEYNTSARDIRRCRQDIIAMAKDGNNEMAEICASRNFFSLSECRDLIFHIQEHRFTLPQIEVALKTLKLGFLGFEFEDHGTLKKFKEFSPNIHTHTSLSMWHKFELENPNTFRGMYQFWCKKL